MKAMDAARRLAAIAEFDMDSDEPWVSTYRVDEVTVVEVRHGVGTMTRPVEHVGHGLRGKSPHQKQAAKAVDNLHQSARPAPSSGHRT